jgi:hypothetical protein
MRQWIVEAYNSDYSGLVGGEPELNYYAFLEKI